MKTIKLIFAVLLLGQLQVFPQTANDYITSGRAYLTATNILAANNSFSNAVVLSPNNPTANVFYAATRLLVWPSQPVGSNFLTRIGVPKAGRNIYNWTAQLPETNGVLRAPAGVSVGEFTAILRTNVLQVLIAAEANLAKVTNNTFTLTLTSGETRGNGVTLDYGDIQMLRAMVQATELFIYTTHSWNLNAQFSAIRSLYTNDNLSMGSVLTNFPSLLTFATTNDAGAARSVFQSGVFRYLKASEFIRNRSSVERLFNLDPYESSGEASFRSTIVALTNSLSGPVALPTDPSKTINLGAYFRNTRSLRSLLPTFSNDSFIAGTLPDPTFGGVVGGLTTEKVESFLAQKAHLHALLVVPGVSLTQVYHSESYYNFLSGVVSGKDGRLYATSRYGGANGYGSIVKVISVSAITNLVSFNVTNGAYPNASLVLGTNGHFYGTTSSGGTNGYGTLFKVTTNGVLTTLYAFSSATGSPGELTRDANGNFHGIASVRGVFTMTPSGTVTFLAAPVIASGTYPRADLVEGDNGSFYGTTYSGGNNGSGTVFKITTNGVLTTLASFNGNNGAYPYAGLVKGKDGNFYGTTQGGGNYSYGTVFKVTTNGVLTTLASFDYSEYGGSPQGGLVQGTDGSFYGTAPDGGVSGYGTVFKVTTNGVLTALMSFNWGNGAYPYAALIQGKDGSFYGTTASGGSNSDGTVFKITSSGVLTTLTSFSWTNGSSPYGGLIQGNDGNFYGMTYSGGTSAYGTVFKITTNGVLTSLVSFNSSNGSSPYGSLIQGKDGQFYGATYNGGTNGYGTLFKITTNAVLTTLVTFNWSNGAYPYAGLIQGKDGNLYGTTYYGGNGSGTVFKVTTSGVLTALGKFGGGDSHSNPRHVIKGSDGNFYGTISSGGDHSYGRIVKITASGTTTLVTFNWSNGAYPHGFVLGNDGNFYGTTQSGGLYGSGTIFRVTLSGTLTTLISFDYENIYTGANPGQLLLGADGNFYGTTHSGGGSGSGTMFKMTPAGIFSPLFWFNEDTGDYPSSLVQAADGSFYGMTYPGSIFRISISSRPAIVNQPDNQTAVVGTIATFDVVANGAAPLRYQWRKNGAAISGATASRYSILNVQTNHAASYSVVVTNSAGSATSSSALLAVLVRPVITTQPRSQTIIAGSNVTFSVTATAPTSLSYQWRKSGAPISGATRSSYSVANVQTNHAANYSVIVANGMATITSSNAVLTVLGRPAITMQPQSLTSIVGNNATFTVTAKGPTPLSYQWRFKGTNLAGATRSSHSITNVQTRHAGSYSVVVGNVAGTVTSSSAVLTVRFLIATATVGNGSISPTPNVLVSPGNAQSFSASAFTNYTVAEWQLDGVRKQTGGTSYTLSNIQANHIVKVVFRPIIKLYWQNTNGWISEWRLNGTNYLTAAPVPSINSAWQMVGQSDFNYDGQLDFLFQNSGGQLLVRTMNGTTFVRDSLVHSGQAAPVGWKLKALNELGGDGYPDFLFQTSTNRLAAWLMNKGTNFLSTALMQSNSPGWRVVGTADFNGDAKKDILWQNSSGNVSVWFMNGRTNLGSVNLRSGQAAAAGWEISAVADLDFNGQKDILLQNSKGQVSAWLMSRTNYMGSVLLRNGQTNAPGWQLKGPK